MARSREILLESKENVRFETANGRLNVLGYEPVVDLFVRIPKMDEK